jgi:hypothetical protein
MIISLLESNIVVHHHVYQDNSYDTVNLGGKDIETQNKSMWHNKALWRHSKRFTEQGKRAKERIVMFSK